MVRQTLRQAGLLAFGALLLTGCGGGGGGGGADPNNSGPVTPQPPLTPDPDPTPEPTPEPDGCFSDFVDASSAWEAYAAGTGVVLYTTGNRSQLRQFDLASRQTTLEVGSIAGHISPSNTGRYVAYLKARSGTDQMYIKDIWTQQERGTSPFGTEFIWGPQDASFFVRAPLVSGLALGSPLAEDLFVSTEYPDAVTWSSDAPLMAAVSRSQQFVYSLETGELLASLDISTEAEGTQNYLPEETRISPDGKWLGFMTQSEAGATLHVLRLETGERRRISVSAARGAAAYYRWSPSSAYIATADWSAGSESSLSVYTLASGKLERVTGSSAGIREFAWSPARDSLAYSTFEGGGNAGRLYLRNFDSSAAAVRLSPQADLEDFAWSPDARYLAYFAVRGDSGKGLYVADAGNSCFRELDRISGNSGGWIPNRIRWSPSSRYLLYPVRGAAGEREFYASTPDGSERHFLNQLIVENSSVEIMEYDWMPGSDTAVFSRRKDDTSVDVESIDIVEIQSLKRTRISRGVHSWFAKSYWLRPGVQAVADEG